MNEDKSKTMDAAEADAGLDGEPGASESSLLALFQNVARERPEVLRATTSAVWRPWRAVGADREPVISSSNARLKNVFDGLELPAHAEALNNAVPDERSGRKALHQAQCNFRDRHGRHASNASATALVRMVA
jgi:hypothetical protein